ncbi:MAG: hypothetical protein WA754_02970, partial [Pseudolabrys sp.]
VSILAVFVCRLDARHKHRRSTNRASTLTESVVDLSAKRHVRFTPKSRHVQCNSACPLSANSGH